MDSEHRRRHHLVDSERHPDLHPEHHLVDSERRPDHQWARRPDHPWARRLQGSELHLLKEASEHHHRKEASEGRRQEWPRRWARRRSPDTEHRLRNKLVSEARRLVDRRPATEHRHPDQGGR